MFSHRLNSTFLNHRSVVAHLLPEYRTGDKGNCIIHAVPTGDILLYFAQTIGLRRIHRIFLTIYNALLKRAEYFAHVHVCRVCAQLTIEIKEHRAGAQHTNFEFLQILRLTNFALAVGNLAEASLTKRHGNHAVFRKDIVQCLSAFRIFIIDVAVSLFRRVNQKRHVHYCQTVIQEGQHRHAKHRHFDIAILYHFYRRLLIAGSQLIAGIYLHGILAAGLFCQ